MSESFGAAEHHVRHREVAEHRPEGHEEDPGGELHPVRDRATDQRDGDDRERHLEHDVDVVVAGDAVQPRQVERVVEERALSAEPHRPADGDVEDADDRHGDVRHHHHVEHGLGPRHAAVEERQRRHGHHEDECRRYEHEGVIAVHETSRYELGKADRRLTALSVPGVCPIAENPGGSTFRRTRVDVAGRKRVPAECYFRVTGTLSRGARQRRPSARTAPGRPGPRPARRA